MGRSGVVIPEGRPADPLDAHARSARRGVLEVTKTCKQEMLERYDAREPDWCGRRLRRFRLRTFRFEFGRWCYIVHPVEGFHDIAWWKWEDTK